MYYVLKRVFDGAKIVSEENIAVVETQFEAEHVINETNTENNVGYSVREVTNIWQEHGYTGRRQYLKSLADEYDVEYLTVLTLANTLGQDEDFDMLLDSLEEASDEAF